jgi:transglutaminase-like putative cysteine protease
MKYKFYIIILWFAINSLNAQNTYTSLLIPDNLKENANSVVRYQLIDINIASQKSMTIKKKKVVTVLNKRGQNNVDAIEFYDKSNKVLAIEATIYNAFGKEIKKIKRKDFIDQSVADGFSILTDSRNLYLDYTPIEYPYTVVFESESQTSNTAFIFPWNPIDDVFESIEKSEFKISYPSNLGFKYKEINFENKVINKIEKENFLSYSVENLSSEKPEDYSPSFQKIFPTVIFSLEKFNLEGVVGNAKNWEDFGKWMYSNLLYDTEEISEETKSKMKNLVGNETDPLKKAKIIYKYVQDKTRYVSIQLGIGGWKPMLSKDVDRLGYGDCKALSNYTRVLLKSVGVESFYTIIYGGENNRSLNKDFVSMQGNHVVLALPVNNKLCFLECTSQVKPFGFEGDFTDDRYALIVTPEKGEIVKTNEYNEKLSSQIVKGNYSINENGDLSATVISKSKGLQYDNRYLVEKSSKDEIDEHYKSIFFWINNLKMEKIKFSNDKENIEFTEDLQFNALGYGSKNGNSIMLPVNVINQSSNIPQRYRNRKNPVEISRGYYDEDEVEINLPVGFVLEAKPDNFTLDDKFGTYKMELIVVNPSKLIYKRSFLQKKGSYDKSEYDNYRKFKEQIAKVDNSKIVITKS